MTQVLETPRLRLVSALAAASAEKGYAATTIIAWAVQGPYFMTAYIAKAIEVALIVTLAVDFARHDGSPVAVVRREIAAFSSLVGRRGTAPVGA